MPRKSKSKKEEITTTAEQPAKLAFAVLFEDVGEKLKGNPFGLVADVSSGFGNGKIIRVIGNSGLHCFARVTETGTEKYKSEFLSSIPSQIHRFLTDLFSSLKIENSGKNFLHPSGVM